MLENDLIELYKPKYNKRNNKIRNVNIQRQFSLIAELHSLKTSWKTFATREEYIKKY